MPKIFGITEFATKNSMSEIINEFNEVASRLDNIETSYVSTKKFQELEHEVHSIKEDLYWVTAELKAHEKQHTREQELLNKELDSLKYEQHIMLTALKWLSGLLIAVGIGLLALSIHVLS